MKFLRTRGYQKEKFSLGAFHDYLWKNGNVPIALLRWEYLGLGDEIERLDAPTNLISPDSSLITVGREIHIEQ